MTTTATRCPDWPESKEHNGTDLDCDGHDGPNWPSIDSMHGGRFPHVQSAPG